MIAAQSVDAAVSALRAGQTVILPTDTVYGLCVDAYHEAPIRRLLRQKKRPKEIPVALVASDLEVILDAVPELRGRAAVMARAMTAARPRNSGTASRITSRSEATRATGISFGRFFWRRSRRIGASW